MKNRVPSPIDTDRAPAFSAVREGRAAVDQVQGCRVPDRSGHVAYSVTGELITSGHGLRDTNPSPDASTPSVPTGMSQRVFFDITLR